MEMPKTTPLYDADYYEELMTFLDKYDDYNLPHNDVETITAPSIDTAAQVLLTMTIILGCAALIILLSALSEKTRAVSATWYVYILALEAVIQALVFTPAANSSKYIV